MQLFGDFLLRIACIGEPVTESYICRSHKSVLSQNAESVIIPVSLSCFEEARLLLSQQSCLVGRFLVGKPEHSLKERFSAILQTCLKHFLQLHLLVSILYTTAYNRLQQSLNKLHLPVVQAAGVTSCTTSNELARAATVRLNHHQSFTTDHNIC
jgi:hypothetical protein